MKKLLAATAIIFLFGKAFHPCSAQWLPVYQDPNALFYDAAFPTDNTGYVAASDSGGSMVLRTNDGGVTWNKKYIFGWSFINKVVMADSLKGYLIKGGVPVKILRTNDGFNTYAVRTLDSSFVVQALELVNDSTGFYLNNATRLRKFEHYGSSFSYVFDTLFDGQNLQFVNAGTGYLDNGDRLLKTNDTGNTWNYANANLGFYCVVFRFADSVQGYFSDGSMIYQTYDGGVSFPQQYNFPDVSSFAAKGNFCMAANNTGNVTYTTNAGLTWQTETTGINLIAPESYIVKITPAGSCFLFSQYCGEIRKRSPVTSGISSEVDEIVITIYPNPFHSAATISFSEHQESVSITITDVTGKEILSESFSGIQFSFERNGLEAGMYFVSVISGKKTALMRKMVVQ